MKRKKMDRDKVVAAMLRAGFGGNSRSTHLVKCMRLWKIAQADGMEEAAKICDRIATHTSPVRAKQCADEIRVKAEEMLK